MITVSKQEVGNWLLMEYMAARHTAQSRLRFFEQKYRQSWEDFDNKIKLSEKEDFDIWDDYIEWKAYVKTAKELSAKIDEVRHGNFAVT
jgi:hypothetical protein